MKNHHETTQKSFQELTLKDNFMFGAVMMDPENCRLLLERILEISIDHVEVDREKSLLYHPDYKGVRLDIFANDKNHTRYNVEMQVEKTDIEKRSRYYHDQIDMALLDSGCKYSTLPTAYVIFICDYDPLDGQKYRYSIDRRCQELNYELFKDGSHTILLSTKGKNPEDVPPELVSFLNFVSADLEESEKESNDKFVKRIQHSIKRIKADREMGERYMTLQEMLDKEKQNGIEQGRAQGHAEGLVQGLAQGRSEGQAEERANTERERQRANTEKQRAENAIQRADLLEEELQKLKMEIAAQKTSK